MSAQNGRPRVLTLARSYPNPAIPLLGLWSQRLVHCVARFAETRVVSPVPWAPPSLGVSRLREFSRFREVPRESHDGVVPVVHPRLPVGPASTTYRLEGAGYALTASRAARRLRRDFPFDAVHAHFLYPDGVAACRIGRRYGVPVVISELVPWSLEFQRSAAVRRQAAWAARTCDALLPVSRYVGRSIAEVLGVEPAEPIPLALDDAMASPPPAVDRDPRQLLFVGAVRHVKGLDVLVDALPYVRTHVPDVRLVVAGDAFYRAYRRDFETVMERARASGADSAIEVVGGRTPAEVARLMAQSAALVVPARFESFSSVIIEAFACGTPVVATRCGGPEELVTGDAGRLVPPGDPVSLAEALVETLADPARYDPAELRRRSLEQYAPEVVAGRLAEIYAAVLTSSRSTPVSSSTKPPNSSANVLFENGAKPSEAMKSRPASR